MNKIASPQDLQAELQRLLTYSQGQNPSRERIASELRGLAGRVAGMRGWTWTKRLDTVKKDFLDEVYLEAQSLEPGVALKVFWDARKTNYLNGEVNRKRFNFLMDGDPKQVAGDILYKHGGL